MDTTFVYPMVRETGFYTMEIALSAFISMQKPCFAIGPPKPIVNLLQSRPKPFRNSLAQEKDGFLTVKPLNGFFKGLFKKDQFFKGVCSPHFYECVDSDNAGHFIAYEFYCPTGTVFDNILLVCNYPWLVSVSINSKWASPLQVSSFGPSSSPKILSFLREKWDSFLCIFSLEVANKKTTTSFFLLTGSHYICVYMYLTC